MIRDVTCSCGAPISVDGGTLTHPGGGPPGQSHVLTWTQRHSMPLHMRTQAEVDAPEAELNASHAAGDRRRTALEWYLLAMLVAALTVIAAALLNSLRESVPPEPAISAPGIPRAS